MSRQYSMTYGELPPFKQFENDITRLDPESRGGNGTRGYWPPGTLYPMELVDAHEIELADGFGDLEAFRTDRHRTGRNTAAQGFRGNERQIYDFLVYLVECFNEDDDGAGDLASSIMTTLGYEWI